jgi:hypothetical protein
MISKRLWLVCLRVGSHTALRGENLVLVQCLSDDLTMNPLSLVMTCVAGWMNRHQQVVIDYLQEEVRVLQEQLGRRPRFNPDHWLHLPGLGPQGVRSVVSPMANKMANSFAAP